MQQTAITLPAPIATAVAMGPRNKRRLVISAISLAVLSAFAAALLLVFRPSNHPTTATSKPKRDSRPLVTQKIVYGMTKAQVLHRIGKPMKTAGTCWQYTENKVIWDGQHIINAERVCFLSGIYSYDYSKMDGEWNYPTTPLSVPKHLG